MLSVINITVEDLLTPGILCIFKSSSKWEKESFADKSCFQVWIISTFN